MSARTCRITYLLQRDAVRSIQRWWKNVTYMNDVYECPVCMSNRLVTRAVSRYTCHHVLCSTCASSWTRQCSRANRQPTCPVCRAPPPSTSVGESAMYSVMEDVITSSIIRSNMDSIHDVHGGTRDVVRELLLLSASGVRSDRARSVHHVLAPRGEPYAM